MKTILFLLLFCVVSSAISPYEVQALFNKGEYKKVCSQDVENLMRVSYDEATMSLYGLACLKIHDINKLALPVAKLSISEAGRENSAYFADILFKKKLLFHALIDNIDISYIRLPKSDYILSYIFDKFVKRQYYEENGVFIFEENNSDTHYEIVISEQGLFPKLILKTFKDNELKSQIEYQ